MALSSSAASWCTSSSPWYTTPLVSPATAPPIPTGWWKGSSQIPHSTSSASSHRLWLFYQGLSSWAMPFKFPVSTNSHSPRVLVILLTAVRDDWQNQVQEGGSCFGLQFKGSQSVALHPRSGSREEWMLVPSSLSPHNPGIAHIQGCFFSPLLNLPRNTHPRRYTQRCVSS